MGGFEIASNPMRVPIHERVHVDAFVWFSNMEAISNRAERNVVSAVTGTLFTHCQNLLQIPSHFPFHEQAPPPWMFRSVFPGFPNDSPPPLSTETGGWLEIIHRHFGRCSHHSAAARVLD
jgi:hypothetical protein